MNESFEIEPSSSDGGLLPSTTMQVILATGVVTVGGVLGGYACGLAIDRFGALASSSLWAFGALLGYCQRKTIQVPSRLLGWAAVAACAIALVIAETCWIHWNIRQGAESFWTAMTLWPDFAQQYRRAVIIAAVFTGLGAWSGYRQIAVR